MERMDEDSPADLVRRAYEVLGRIHEGQFELDEALATWEALIAEGERRENIAMRISGMNKRSFVRGVFLGQVEEALEELGSSELLAEAATFDEGVVEACVANCYIRSALADFDKVEYYMEKVANLGETLGLVEPTIFGMTHHSNTLVFLTRFDEALELAEKTLAKAEEHGHLKFQAELLTFSIPYCHLRNGDVEAASAALERGMEIALQIGDRASELFAAVVQGRIALNRGDFDEAVASHQRGIDAAAATGIPYAIALGSCTAGTCYRRIGGDLLDRASKLHDQTLETMEMPTGRVHGAWMWSEIGHCSLQNGNVDRAEELFRMALDEETASMWLLRPSALAGIVEVALARGDVEGAAAAFEDLRSYITSRKMVDRYIEVELLGARVAAAQGDSTRALSSLTRTQAITEREGLDRMLFDVHVLRGELLAGQGDDEGATGAQDAARAVADRILAGTRGEDLRTAFKKEVAALLG